MVVRLELEVALKHDVLDSRHQHGESHAESRDALLFHHLALA